MNKKRGLAFLVLLLLALAMQRTPTSSIVRRGTISRNQDGSVEFKGWEFACGAGVPVVALRDPQIVFCPSDEKKVSYVVLESAQASAR